MNTHILGIKVNDRMKSAVKVQELLTEYGNHIKTRLGMHVPESAEDSASGLIIIELSEEAGNGSELTANLTALPGVQVQIMSFT